MKEPCLIKGQAHGLLLQLNPDVKFETIIYDICGKFASARDFFGAAHLVLSVAGMDLDADQMEAVIQAIEYNSDVVITLVTERDGLRDAKALKQIERFYYDKIEENATIVAKSVKNGETIISDQSLIVLGDVAHEAVLQAAGSIIVLGEMCGSICAGRKNKESSFIISMEPGEGHLSIGQLEMKLERPKKKHFFFKDTPEPMVYEIRSGQIEGVSFYEKYQENL